MPEKKIADLQKQISRYELAEQKMRDVQSRLDFQIETFTRIYEYNQRAFHVSSLEELNDILTEGVVDIFQVELGAVFSLSPAGDNLILANSCNLDCSNLTIPLDQDWLARKELWDFKKQKAMWESPVPANSPWVALDLAHGIFMPLFNNERGLDAVILGGVTNSRKNFYDFLPQESLSSFTVYTQQMNGIYNNFAALSMAKKAGIAKTEFMANLSHEMRTPMNAIIGMTQIAKRSDQPNELKKALQQIEISSSHLLHLINDVLDISKIEEGKMALSAEAFNLCAVIENLLNSLRQSAADKQQELFMRCDGMANTFFIGDAMRLSQVLINLLSNAVKFTPQYGKVSLRVEELSRDEEKSLLRFSVTDNGIGMGFEQQKKIFSPFEQADNSISRKYGGTGLGLAISQRIVELMGGKIKVDSQIGRGSRFYFTAWLTFAEAGQEQKSGEEPGLYVPDLVGKRALIVDDIEINRHIIAAFLSDTNIVQENAENGQQALTMVEQSSPNYYDLILMDVQMPVMDGYTATKAIRSLPREDVGDMIILAMTANVFKEDVERSIENGMNGHIGKPIEYAVLMKSIAQAFEKRAAQPSYS